MNYIKREEFLSHRKSQIEQFKKMNAEGKGPQWFKDFDICDPNTSIACDICHCDIYSHVLSLHGGILFCNACLERKER